MITLGELQDIARRARDPSWQSYMNCRPINEALREAIRDKTECGVDATVVEGKVAKSPRARWGEEHAWVSIPASDVEGTSRRVIVDGALDQFCEENKEDGIVGIAVGPRSRFDSVEVLTHRDELYQHYLW